LAKAGSVIIAANIVPVAVAVLQHHAVLTGKQISIIWLSAVPASVTRRTVAAPLKILVINSVIQPQPGSAGSGRLPTAQEVIIALTSYAEHRRTGNRLAERPAIYPVSHATTKEVALTIVDFPSRAAPTVRGVGRWRGGNNGRHSAGLSSGVSRGAGCRV
jgi:hypothetical protein